MYEARIGPFRFECQSAGICQQIHIVGKRPTHETTKTMWSRIGIGDSATSWLDQFNGQERSS